MPLASLRGVAESMRDAPQTCFSQIDIELIIVDWSEARPTHEAAVITTTSTSQSLPIVSVPTTGEIELSDQALCGHRPAIDHQLGTGDI